MTQVMQSHKATHGFELKLSTQLNSPPLSGTR